MTSTTTAWLDRVRALQVIAQEGLTYANNPFDVDRFTRLRDLTAEIAEAVLTAPGEPDGALRTVVSTESGYLTPKLDVRAAVVDGRGRLLLVRETTDGKWAMPGGWADVGETLGEGIVREVREEAGYDVVVDGIIGIYDRDRTGHSPYLHSVLKAVLRCRLVGGEALTSAETDAVAWFAQEDVPELSTYRNSPELVARVFAHLADPTLPPDL